MRYISVISITLALTLTACDEHREQPKVVKIEASATASVDSDGNVTTQEANASDLAEVKRHGEMYDDVDRRFPLPEIPTNAPRVKATRVLSTGKILLEDGRSVVLDGVTCAGIGNEYLGRILVGPEISLVVAPTDRPTSGAIPANIWVFEKLESMGESRTFPADGGITSGWCSARPTATSTLNNRFAALELAFARERERYAKSAR